MAPHRVFLGWCRLLETDEAGLAALAQICAALDIHTYRPPGRQLLFLASPVQGRVIAVDSAGCAPGSGAHAAALRLADQLRAAGAEVLLLTAAHLAERNQELQQVQPDLLLVLYAQPQLQWLEAVFSTVLPGRSRLLAHLLLESVAAATGLQARAVRFRWPRARSAALLAGVDAPAVMLAVPELPPGRPDGESWPASLAQGIWEGVLRFLSTPELTELIQQMSMRRMPPATVWELPPVAGGEDGLDLPVPVAEVEAEIPHEAPEPPTVAAPPAREQPRAEAPPPRVETPPADPLRPPGARQVYEFQMQPGGRPAFVARPRPPAPRPPASGGPPPPAGIPFKPHTGKARRPGGHFPARRGQSVPLGDTITYRSHWHRSHH